MKAQVKTPLMVVIGVVVVGVLFYFGSKALSAGDLDQGQVKYTPGKPPWMETDPSKQGPGAHGPGAGGPPPAGAPTGPDGAQHAPAGMTGPNLGNK